MIYQRVTPNLLAICLLCTATGVLGGIPVKAGCPMQHQMWYIASLCSIVKIDDKFLVSAGLSLKFLPLLDLQVHKCKPTICECEQRLANITNVVTNMQNSQPIYWQTARRVTGSHSTIQLILDGPYSGCPGKFPNTERSSIWKTLDISLPILPSFSCRI